MALEILAGIFRRAVEKGLIEKRMAQIDPSGNWLFMENV